MAKTLTYELSGTNFKLSEANRNYLVKKIEKLIDYIPKKAREPAHAEAKVEKIATKSGDQFEVSLLLSLPGRDLLAKEVGLDPQAAIDLVEVKIRGQLRRYKLETGHFRILTKLRKRQK